jgi:heme exporter protein C
MTARMTRILGWLAVAALAGGLVMAFAVAPREVTQGNVQRIMYVHVPAVLVAYLAFAVVFAGSIAYLWKRAAAADRVAHASAEVGLLFLGVSIATGAIWGKPTWGTWWTWDARITSVTIVFVIFLGYLLLRGMTEDPERGARYAAVLGIVGALNIPLVHQSVNWWRTLHQPASMLKAGGITMPASILVPVLVNVAAFALLCAYFVVKRTRLLQAEQEAAA